MTSTAWSEGESYSSRDLTFLRLFAALSVRDMCSECGGQSFNVVDIEDEPEFEPCRCSMEANETLSRATLLFAEIMQEFVMDKSRFDANSQALSYVLSCVGDVYLGGVFQFEAIRREVDVIELVVFSPAQTLAFTGHTFLEAYEAAISGTHAALKGEG